MPRLSTKHPLQYLKTFTFYNNKNHCNILKPSDSHDGSLGPTGLHPHSSATSCDAKTSTNKQSVRTCLKLRDPSPTPPHHHLKQTARTWHDEDHSHLHRKTYPELYTADKWGCLMQKIKKSVRCRKPNLFLQKNQ